MEPVSFERSGNMIRGIIQRGEEQIVGPWRLDPNLAAAAVRTMAGPEPRDKAASSALAEAARDVLEWAEMTGGWDAPAWGRLREALDRFDAARPAQRSAA